jgi:hypothetical protein
MRAVRKVGGWLCIVAISASLASATTGALAGAVQEAESLQTPMRIEPTALQDEGIITSGTSSALAAVGHMPDGIAGRADVSSAGKVQVTRFVTNDVGSCVQLNRACDLP